MIILALLSWWLPQVSPVLGIQFTNIGAAKGQLYLAVYNSPDGFMKEDKALLKKIIPVNQSGAVQLDLPAMAPGVYAFSAFHDVNGNGKLDKNLVGIPTEPYGFSNGARPKFRPPNWEETKITLGAGAQFVGIRLETW